MQQVFYYTWWVTWHTIPLQTAVREMDFILLPPSSPFLSLSLSLQYLFYNEQQLQIMRLATTERELKISAMEIIYQGIHREEIYERV